MFEQCITGKHVNAISGIRASCNVVGSECGCILWSHIQFFPSSNVLVLDEATFPSGDAFDAGEID